MEPKFSRKCRDHPDEFVGGICSDHNCDKPLCCMKCALTDHGKTHREQFLTINDFASNAAKMFQAFKQTSLLNERIPQDYLVFIGEEDEHVEKLAQHVEKEKTNVEDAFQKLLKSFEELCQETKQKVFEELDSQVKKLKANLQRYKTRLDTLYNEDCHIRTFLTKDGIIDKLTECKTFEDYEFTIKELNEIIYERQSLGESENKKAGFTKNAIKKLTEDIMSQVALKPQTSFVLMGNFEKLCEEMKDSAKIVMPQYFSLQNTVDSLVMTHTISYEDSDWNSSKILQNESERKMISEWISDKNVTYTLLYRGTTDGYSYQNVHDKIGSSKPTVCLIEATTNKRFGGFADHDWTMSACDGDWKTSGKNFIFSISDQEKYTMKQGYEQHSLRFSKEHLIGFGGGCGISLAIDGNINTENVCNFACWFCAFDNKGKSNESLAGSQYFQIKELEIYRVDIS